MKNKQAVVLLSGGLDSATALFWAKSRGFKCHCLIFDYGQRHRREIEYAGKLAKKAGIDFKLIKISLPWKGSALLDKKKNLPKSVKGIPSTYVPARNIIFLSFALSYAETIGAEAIFIGAHVQDYSGYPDCRPEFLRAFQEAAKKGTKSGVEKRKIEILAPLIDLSKTEIIKLGKKLGVPFGLTWSCYQGAKEPCGKCDSCYYRARGFAAAGLKDEG